MANKKDLINYLTGLKTSAGFFDSLKIRFRPLICPFEDLIKLADHKSTVYDIGCGSGQFCAVIRRFAGIAKIKGIETNSKLIENAKQLNNVQELSDLRFEVYDGKNIPDDIKEYELIYMIDVLHHIPSKIHQEFLFNLYQKMASGSMFILKDIDGGSPLVVINKIHDMIFSGELGNEQKIHNTTQMLSKAGFRIIGQYNKREFLYPHTFFICEKP